jgi:ectoine hydroxylase-related dioxygenase (phytanoyl-CoA dioxygenase family)
MVKMNGFLFMFWTLMMITHDDNRWNGTFAMVATAFTPSSPWNAFQKKIAGNKSQQQKNTYRIHTSCSSPFILHYGLYEVQEEMLTKRAQFEETLMSNASSQPLLANKPKGAGTSGGFGSGSKSKNHKNNKKQSSSGSLSSLLMQQQGWSHAQVMRSEGVVRIDQALTTDMADAMRSFVLQYRTEAQQLVESQQIPFRHRFADVLLRKHRSDVTMPFHEITYRALHQVLCQSSVGATHEILLGKNAILQEFSCLISDSGSDRQVIHPDTPFLGDTQTPVDDEDDHDDNDPILCTCFIALQDITPEMGPTVWLPRTHTRAIHAQFRDETIAENETESPKDALLRSRPAVLGTLQRGCCAIYDSRVLHCGTANRSDTSRALFYVSFKRPNISYTGNPPSIRPELQGKL